MFSFEREIKENNIQKALQIQLASSIKDDIDLFKAVALVTESLNVKFKEGILSEDALEKSFSVIDDILKARTTKYIRREGSPGNYRYIYKEKQGKGGKKEEKVSSKKEEKSKKLQIPKGLEDEDKEDFTAFINAYNEGDLKNAKNIADNFDTYLREQIPPAVWKEMGGKLTPKGEASLTTKPEESTPTKSEGALEKPKNIERIKSALMSDIGEFLNEAARDAGEDDGEYSASDFEKEIKEAESFDDILSITGEYGFEPDEVIDSILKEMDVWPEGARGTEFKRELVNYMKDFFESEDPENWKEFKSEVRESNSFDDIYGALGGYGFDDIGTDVILPVAFEVLDKREKKTAPKKEAKSKEKLIKKDPMDIAKDANQRGILDDDDMEDLEWIASLAKQGKKEMAKKHLDRLDSLVREYGQDLVKAVIDHSVIVLQLNDDISKGILKENLESLYDSNDTILKARNVKYYKREGSPGNYKYYYTKAEYDKVKNSDSKLKSDKEILDYYKELKQIESEEGHKSSKIKLNPEMDTISKFSHSGSDTTKIKQLIKEYENTVEKTKKDQPEPPISKYVKHPRGNNTSPEYNNVVKVCNEFGWTKPMFIDRLAGGFRVRVNLEQRDEIVELARKVVPGVQPHKEAFIKIPFSQDKDPINYENWD